MKQQDSGEFTNKVIEILKSEGKQLTFENISKCEQRLRSKTKTPEECMDIKDDEIEKLKAEISSLKSQLEELEFWKNEAKEIKEMSNNYHGQLLDKENECRVLKTLNKSREDELENLQKNQWNELLAYGEKIKKLESQLEAKAVDVPTDDVIKDEANKRYNPEWGGLNGITENKKFTEGAKWMRSFLQTGKSEAIEFAKFIIDNEYQYLEREGLQRWIDCKSHDFYVNGSDEHYDNLMTIGITTEELYKLFLKTKV